MSLDQIVEYIAGIVKSRAADGNNFGIVLIPEGLIPHPLAQTKTP